MFTTNLHLFLNFARAIGNRTNRIGFTTKAILHLKNKEENPNGYIKYSITNTTQKCDVPSTQNHHYQTLHTAWSMEILAQTQSYDFSKLL